MDTRSGFRIATIRGIPIRIHYAFLLIIPFLAYGFGRELVAAARMAQVPAERLRGSIWLWGLGLALALFASVLIHELAHSFYAIRHGGRVRAITLLPIGGVSELVEAPREPEQEAVMALVGPVTSLLLGVVCYGAFRATLAVRQFDVSFGLYLLGYLNLSLGFFNLLPAFPMDGGRILRALLARRKGTMRATQIAAAIGKAFAALFAVAGIVSGNLILVLVALFVFLGAEGEKGAVLARALLGDLRVRDVMTPETEAVPSAETLYAAGERMIQARRLALPVADGGRVVGVLTAQAIEQVPLERRQISRANEVAEAAPSIEPDERAAEALRILDERGLSALPVTHGGSLLGTISRDEIANGLRLRQLEASQRRRGVSS